MRLVFNFTSSAQNGVNIGIYTLMLQAFTSWHTDETYSTNTVIVPLLLKLLKVVICGKYKQEGPEALNRSPE